MQPFSEMGTVGNLFYIQAHAARPAGCIDGLGWLDPLSYSIKLFKFITDQTNTQEGGGAKQVDMDIGCAAEESKRLARPAPGQELNLLDKPYSRQYYCIDK